jgi:lactate permease
MSIIAHFVPIFAASFLVPFPVLRRSWLFVLLSVWSCVLPAQALSFYSYEFPSLLGGLVGVIVTGGLAKFKVSRHPR